MTSKEISVLIIGIMLVAFLYLMKHPFETNNNNQFAIEHNKSIGIEKFTEDDKFDFNPTTQSAKIESISEIPAWQLDNQQLEISTQEELSKLMQKAIDEQRYFSPEKDNALLYLLRLKLIDPQNSLIAETTDLLTENLIIKSQLAINENDQQSLTSIISKTKTLDNKNNNIKYLQEKLAVIKTINKLFKKGKKQIQNNQLITENSQDAWHTAKQALDIDSNNTNAQKLAKLVNTQLVENALRAAEETDFQLANNQIQQAQLLTPLSQKVITAKNKIDELKQKRYIWLEQQMSQAITKTNISRAKKMLSQLSELGLQNSQLSGYQNEIKRMQTYGKYQPKQQFAQTTPDNIQLPTMVVIPTGSFNMGSNDRSKNERPVHNVNINYGFAVSQNEISVEDFKKFITDTNYKTDAKRKNSSRIYDLRTGRLKNKHRINWQKDYLGKKAKPQLPVIHVSWNDAVAYTQWISDKTGQTYRLLSESEFEYVLRSGSHSYYPWGNDSPKQIIENLTGQLDRLKGNSRIKWQGGFKGYNDNHWGPAPVGSFITNQFNLNDTAGNVMEWVSDCWHDSYIRAPSNGKAWVNSGCKDHVIRGGSWSSAKGEFTSSHRFKASSNFTDARLGFRIARDLK